MKRILVFLSPFLFVGLLLGVILIFGEKGLLLTLYIFIVVGFLSFLGAILVNIFGD